MVVGEILANNPLFDGVEKEDIGKILNCLGSAKRSYKKGDFIFLAGQSVPEVSILISGRAQVVKESIFGDAMLIGHLGPGDIFAETYACMGADTIPISVIAFTNCEVLMMDLKRVVQTCSNSCVFHQRMIFNLMKVLASNSAALNKKMSYLTYKTIRGRLAAYFFDCAEQAMTQNGCPRDLPKTIEFELPFSRTELADYLCVDRSAMSRELSNMRKEGILDFSGRKVILHEKFRNLF